MTDEDAIERRERIFNQLRESQIEYNKLNDNCEEISNQLTDLRQQARDKRNHIEQLVKLIRIMILHDCCPVEAQLKYPNELEDNEDNIGSQKAYSSNAALVGSPSKSSSKVGWF